MKPGDRKTPGDRLRNGALLLAVAGYCSGLALPGMIAMLLAQIWNLRTAAWRWIPTPLDVPLAALALAVTASAIASPWRADAAARAIFFVLAVVVSIPAVASYVRSGADRVRTLLLVWIGGGVAAALFGVIQAWHSRFTIMPSGADLESNRLGTTLASALVLALGLIMGATFKARWLMVATAILFAGLLATMSRSAWVAAVAGLVVLMVFGAGGRGRLTLALVWGIVGVVGVFVLARPFASVWKPGAKAPSMHQVLGEVRSLLNLQQNRNRLVLWRTAMRIAADHPVFGTGFGTFGLAFAEYRPPEIAQLETRGDPPFAHNVFLNFAAETGIPGLAAFVLLYATGLISTWRWLTRSPPASTARAIALAVLAALVTILTNEFFEGTAMTVHTGFGVLALLTIGAAGTRYLAPEVGARVVPTTSAQRPQGTDGVPLRSPP
ncbi:MAG: O-antigen ligase family protein [bacterium]